MRKRLVALVVALAVPAALLVPLAADAEKPAAKAAADAGDTRYDPENVTAISQYMETLVKGNQRLDAKDTQGAIDLYRKAAQLKPKDALAPYLMGEAFLVAANLPEAEGALQQAVELSGADPKTNPVVRAQALFLMADVYERERKLDAAKVAWKAYGDFAATMKDAGAAHPDTSTARLKAIDEWLALDKKYEIVRQRIAAEKAAAADAGTKDAGGPKK